MRVVIVSHDTFWPLRGGGGIRVYWVAKSFIKKNCDVSVIAPILHTEGLKKEFDSVHIMTIGRWTRFVKFKEIVYIFMMMKMLIRLFLRKYDLIYAHNAVAGLPSVLAGKLMGIPVIYDMDDLLTGYSRNWFVYHFGSIMEKVIAQWSDITIVVSKGAKKWCTQNGINRTVIVRHGVDLRLFHLKNQERKYITFTGGMEVNDGLLLIPLAAQDILKEFPNIVFMFVGNGKDMNRLIQLVENLHLTSHFIFKGWMDHVKIPDILAQSKIGLITSLKVSATEFSSPLRSYEYMASELPFVAPDLEGILEQVEESRAGIIFKNGNAKDLAKAVLKLLHDDNLCKTLGRNGRCYVTQYGDWMKNADKICEISEGFVN